MRENLGNHPKWESNSWILSKGIQEQSNVVKPCEHQCVYQDIYFPKASGNFFNANLNCQKIGGIIPLPVNKSQALLLVDLARKNIMNAQEWGMMWIPLLKDSTDSSKLYYYTGSWKYNLDRLEPDWLDWHLGQPNGENVESCVGMDVSKNAPSYYDIECSQSLHHICRVRKITLFKIRGLCKNLERTIDTNYFVNFEENINNVYKDLVWTGYSKSKIVLDKRMKRWKIMSVKNESTLFSAANQVKELCMFIFFNKYSPGGVPNW